MFSFQQNRQVLFPADFSFFVSPFSGLLEPLALRGKQFFGFRNQTFQRRFEQYFPDFRRERQVFAQGDTPRSLRQRHKPLRDDQPQTGQERGRHLKAFLKGKDIDDPGQGFRHRTGMHRGIGGNAYFRALDHAPERFGIAAFPDEHHVRRDTRGVARGRMKIRQVVGDHALGNRPARVWNGVKIKFRGRFVGADMTPARFNDLAQESGKQRGFSRPHDAGNEHKAVFRKSVIRYFPLDA